MVCDISSLPEEVLIKIFQCLNFESRLTVSLVCKRWLYATNCGQFLSDTKIKISKKNDKAVKFLSNMTRRFECFSFHEVTIGDFTVEFLKKYSSQFVMLSFVDCYISKCKKNFRDKILHCDNLKTLDVHRTDIISWFASLPNLSSLYLYLYTGLSDYVISELGKSLSKLEVLSLGTEILPEEEMYNYNPSSSSWSFLYFKMLIEKNRTTLQYIDFRNLRLSPEALVTISEIESLKLRSVVFPYKLTSEYIKVFCANQFSLTSLDLSYVWPEINDRVRDICKCLPNLHKLVIQDNFKLNIRIHEIFQLQHLLKLDLSECRNISDMRCQDAPSLKTFKLIYLDLSLSKINDWNLNTILNCNHNISYLNVTGTKISDITLNMICKSLIFLECLILDSCKTISDSGLTGELENDPDYLTPTPLSNLKYLKVLNLSRNSLITNYGCIQSIRFPDLECLELCRCDSLVLNKDFEIELKEQNPSLQFLHFCNNGHRTMKKKYLTCQLL